MKALFVHDHKFSIDENGNILSHLMDGQLWQRYLDHCDSLTVLTRKIILDDSDRRKGLRSAEYENVDFTLYGKTKNADGTISPMPPIKQIAKGIREAVSKSDVVIARLPSYFGYMACKEAIRQNKKYAVEVVACAWDSNFYHGNPKNKILAFPGLMTMKHYVKKADAAIYVTDEYLQKIYPCKGMTGIASNVVIDIPERDVLQKRLERIESQSGVFKFGLVGSMEVNFKGHDTAMKALSSIRESLPPFELHFIGDGKPDKWREMAKSLGMDDVVCFDGLKKSGAEVIDWLDSLDMLLIPSLQEGLPRALIEAMSRGLPALGAITGGIPQLLTENYLHKKKDYHKLASDILRLSGDKQEMKRCAESNFDKVKRFDSEILYRQRFDFWKSFFDSCKAK